MIEQVDAPPASRRSKRRWVIGGLALLVVAASAIGIPVYIHWRDNPNLFISFGSSMGADKASIGETEVFSPAIYTKADRTVDLRSVTLRDVTNTARATVSVVLCEKRPGADNVGGGGITDLRAECATITPFRPGKYRLQFNSTDQLFVEITPHQAGTVRIKGFQVRYHDGVRRGDQLVGLELYTNSH